MRHGGCTAHIPNDKETLKRMGFSVQAPLLKHTEHHHLQEMPGEQGGTPVPVLGGYWE